MVILNFKGELVVLSTHRKSTGCVVRQTVQGNCFALIDIFNLVVGGVAINNLTTYGPVRNAGHSRKELTTQ